MAPTHAQGTVTPRNRPAQPETRGQKAAMQAKMQKSTPAFKRKRNGDDDHSPRKKVQTEGFHTPEIAQARYREPKGVRKSDRIAGRPADPRDPPPRGQYNRDETHPDVPVSPDPVAVQPDSAAVREITDQEHVPGDEYAINPRSRVRDLLEVLASNVSSHRIVRRLADGYNKWVHRADACEYAQDGLKHLEDQLQDMEKDADASEEDVAGLRGRCRTAMQRLEECENVIRSLEEPMKDLNAKHANHNNRLYDYIDMARDDAELQHLPMESWTEFSRCCEAYTVCRDVELDMHGIE